MKESSICAVTHQHIAVGPCVWCGKQIRNGNLCEIPSRSESSDAVWNWEAIQDSLRTGIRSVRLLTIENLARLSNLAEEVLLLLAPGLIDIDSEIRLATQDACCRIGTQISREQASRMLGQELTQTFEFANRIALLAHCFSGRNDSERAVYKQAHVLWIIEHYPESATAVGPYMTLSKSTEPTAYTAARSLWLRQCAANESHAIVLGNAASFFCTNEPDLAEQLLLRAQSLEPMDPQWHESLGHLYARASGHQSSEVRIGFARKALAELECADALRLSYQNASSEESSRTTYLISRHFALPELAKLAFEAGEIGAAQLYACELLNTEHSEQIAELTCKNGNAIHYAHLVLGRIALRRGELEDAKRRLMESANIEGSPTLSSFGPNMSLAKELLEEGESEVVLEYFDRCEKFWEYGAARLAEWRMQIELGQIPEFGANLTY